MFLKDLIGYLETLAPLAYQETYDNSGLIVGNLHEEITGVLVSLDMTELVVEEAIEKQCNLIVAHHPVLFKPLKSLTGKNYVEKTLLKAIKNDVALYAIHTNLDNIAGGVNFHIAERLGLENVRILSPKNNVLSKLTTFCPSSHYIEVLEALWQAGAGEIGNYRKCSFRVAGHGTFQANQKADPFLGTKNTLEEAEEYRLEVLVSVATQTQVLRALRASHPYEEIAYDLIALENVHSQVGSGAIGTLPEEMAEQDFLIFLKEKMNLQVLKHTDLRQKPIKNVAICGGSGGFLLKKALSSQADIFVTSDVKYHEFFDADNKIILADIGHYESEIFTKELLSEVLLEKFRTIVVKISETVTNPVHYF